MHEIIIPEKITEDLAEESGLHIGDGSMGLYNNGNYLMGVYSLRWHIKDDREHYDKFISDCSM